MEPISNQSSLVNSEHEKTLKFFRTCAMTIAAIEMILGALAMTSNLGIFTYYVVEASNGNGNKRSEFFFENVLDLDLHIPAKTFSKIAAFMFLYSVMHFVASIFLFQGAKTLSHEKCRWSFILHVCLWTVGIIVILAPLNDKMLLWLFIVVFSLKIAELALIKRLMDELHYRGFDI